MEAPQTLKQHFAVVDDFFKKTFREDRTLFVGLKTVQYADQTAAETLPYGDSAFTERGSTVSAPSSHRHSSSSPAVHVIPTTQGPAFVALPANVKPKNAHSNFFALSPRLQFLHSGDTVGKLKVLCGVAIPRVCQLEQGVQLASNGMIKGQMKLRDLIEGMDVTGRIAVNTIASAAEDASSLQVAYRRSDVFSEMMYQRNGLGSSNVAVDFGSKFLNLMVGAGFERQQLSLVEIESGAEQINAMYVGGGFTGWNWSMGTKFTHVNGVWGSGRIAVLQKLKPSTTVACAYDLDIATSKVKVSLGFSQGMLLRLPYVLRPSNYSSTVSTNSSSTTTPTPAAPLVFPHVVSVPLVFAFKAESTGTISGTVRTVFNNAIRIGLVGHYNMNAKHSKPRVGVIISLEDEAC